jgi:hypothetical protein
MGSTLSIYRSECLVVRSEEETKGNFLRSWIKPCDMWHCFNWQNATFRRRIIFLTILGSNSGRNFACFSKVYYLFQNPIVIFQVHVVIKPKGFQMLTLILFFRLSVTTVFISWVIIDFQFLFLPRYSFLLCVGKLSWFESFCVSVYLIFNPLLISEFHFFACQEKCSFLSPDILTSNFIVYFYVTVISNNILSYISLCRP